MTSCIIVEDNPAHSDQLSALLGELDEPVYVLGMVTNVDSAVKAITDLKPGLVFLDIELEGELSFEILKRLKKIDFDIIFTTHHTDRYISEMRVCDVPYLTKRVVKKELEEALEKIKRQSKKVIPERVRTMLANLTTKKNELKGIWLRKDHVAVRIEIGDIVYILSDNKASIFHILNKDKYFSYNQETPGLFERTTRSNVLKFTLDSSALGNWEHDLEHLGFYRIHNETLVNLDHVIRVLEEEDGDKVLMSTKEKFSISRRRKKDFLKILGIP